MVTSVKCLIVWLNHALFFQGLSHVMLFVKLPSLCCLGLLTLILLYRTIRAVIKCHFYRARKVCYLSHWSLENRPKNCGFHVHFMISVTNISCRCVVEKSSLVKSMTWCGQAVSHYCKQCWTRRHITPFGPNAQSNHVRYRQPFWMTSHGAPFTNMVWL